MEEPAAEAPRALSMPPMVLLARTRKAFLLARAPVVANNQHEWWAKIAIPLGSDVTGGDPSVDYRWVHFKMLTKCQVTPDLAACQPKWPELGQRCRRVTLDLAKAWSLGTSPG
ncbi:hypothetical protein Nocox_07790 [Nonomuraea coxensis DSM 45129]|uniref:Uncharacterized protein n=1 Tax=Nonomuraea coxensis DSM 45129 TaxID=1122611 RepID=A0ABX8TUY2_9ACTN|nr:hypothetical protein [Nonomuraea coxensis]QYC39183.1 hypothetical protein Nocox_07790 [Nonomuraea coxensis DSM 45129]